MRAYHPGADASLDEPRVRFDDLRTNPARSFGLAGPVRTVEARDVADVLPALEEVALAVGGGLWAGGFVAYEAAPAFDPAFEVRPAADPELPLVWFGLFDRAEEVATFDDGPDPSTAGYELSPWTPSIDRASYDAAIEGIRELIAAGETYQVNFAFRLRSAFAGDDLALYRDLCLAQRAAHCAYVGTGRHRILSASPELFFELDGERITSRPMKGTARRGRWTQEDHAAAASLVASGKDRAENAMIADLIRSDVGRIAVPGSVQVPRLFEAERYETVWQLTSTVTSRLPPGLDPVSIFAALFPCGSVTGAPKVSTMRTIAALEDSPRGVYTGAVGFFAPPGSPGPSARFNVAIRTVVLDAAGGAEYGVGGGITWDSSPSGEYDECRAKAEVLTLRRPRFDLTEALRFEPPAGFTLLEGHLERLAGSAGYFGFAYDEAVVRKELDAAADGHRGPPMKVRLTLSRDGHVAASTSPIASPGADPVRVAVHPEAVDPRDPLRYHKTTMRAGYERAVAAHPEADDVVLVNYREEVAETSVANLAVRLDGRWWTPPLGSGCLPGIYRAALLADGTLAERSLTLEDLRRAEALAVISSVRLWRPAVLLPA